MNEHECDFSPGGFMIVEPRPKAHVWIGPDGKVATVIVTDAPESTTLPDDLSGLIFPPDWDVSVTVLGVQP